MTLLNSNYTSNNGISRIYKDIKTILIYLIYSRLMEENIFILLQKFFLI